MVSLVAKIYQFWDDETTYYRPLDGTKCSIDAIDYCPINTWANNSYTESQKTCNPINGDTNYLSQSCSYSKPSLCYLYNPNDEDRTFFWSNNTPKYWEVAFNGEGYLTPDVVDPYLDKLNNNLSTTFNQQSISCEYGVDEFKSFGDILNYNNKFIATTRAVDASDAINILNTVIYPHFCSLESLDCPIDPLKPGENVQQPRCSRFTSLDPEGDLCRTWAATFPSQADVIKIQYCHQLENIDKSECACINKVYNPLYIAIKKDVLAPDSCWFTPCSNESQFLIPSVETRVVACPDVCGLIIQNYGDADIDLTDANIYIDCTKGQEPNPQNKTVPIQPQGIGIKSINQQPKEYLFIWEYNIPIVYWVLAAIVVFLVVIVGVMVCIKK